jgi:hypothetical protein
MYKKIQFPESSGDKPFKEMSKKEAKAYYNWLVKVKFERTVMVLEHFGIKCDPNNLELQNIIDLEERILEKIYNDDLLLPKKENSSWVLKPLASSYAFDLGLVFQEFILQKFPQLDFVLSTEKRKKMFDYNRSVVVGFKEEWKARDLTNEGIARITRRVLKMDKEEKWSSQLESIVKSL